MKVIFSGGKFEKEEKSVSDTREQLKKNFKEAPVAVATADVDYN